MSSPKKIILWRDSLLCSLLAVFFTLLFYLVVVNVNFLNPFEKILKDFRFTDIYHAQSLNERKADRHIVLINVQHHDRQAIAKAIDQVQVSQPKVVGIDLIFNQPKDPIKDSVLQATLGRYDNIVTAMYLEDGTRVENHPRFQHPQQQQGYITLNESERDRVVRSFTGYAPQYQGLFSFATQLCISAGKLDETWAKQKLTQPLAINYFGNEASFLTFDLDELHAQGNIPALKDAIVIFGYLGTPTGNPNDIEDKHFTPLNKEYAGRSIPDMYGVLIHANIIKMLSEKNYILTLPFFVTAIIAFVICFFTVMLGIVIYRKNNFRYYLIMKIKPLLVSLVLLFITLVFYRINVHFYITPILVLTLMGLNMITLYRHLLIQLKPKISWKSYLLD